MEYQCSWRRHERDQTGTPEIFRAAALKQSTSDRGEALKVVLVWKLCRRSASRLLEASSALAFQRPSPHCQRASSAPHAVVGQAYRDSAVPSGRGQRRDPSLRAGARGGLGAPPVLRGTPAHPSPGLSHSLRPPLRLLLAEQRPPALKDGLFGTGLRRHVTPERVRRGRAACKQAKQWSAAGACPKGGTGWAHTVANAALGDGSRGSFQQEGCFQERDVLWAATAEDSAATT